MADVYDRASIFLEALYRRWDLSAREHNLVLVTHGLFILVFLMRLFRYSLEDFYTLDNMTPSELVVLERPEMDTVYDVSARDSSQRIFSLGDLVCKYFIQILMV